MSVEVKCKICNKVHKVCPSRVKAYKTCSKECNSIYRKRNSPLNAKCKVCEKEFHLKPSQILRNNKMGCFCSRSCSNNYKKTYYIGKNNPNFRDAKLDNGYRVHNYLTVGKMKEHKYITLTYLQIDELPKNYCIHHRDCHIYNNSVENLAVLSNSEHRWLHGNFGNAVLWAFMNNKIKIEDLLSWTDQPEKAKRLLTTNLTNQIGVFKQGELLENHNNDNQQPSLISNDLGGSTTNTRVQTDNAEDSNGNTSALPGINEKTFQITLNRSDFTSDDIV